MDAPADADGTLVNGPRKTNATFGVACFSFGLLKLTSPALVRSTAC